MWLTYNKTVIFDNTMVACHSEEYEFKGILYLFSLMRHSISTSHVYKLGFLLILAFEYDWKRNFVALR